MEEQHRGSYIGKGKPRTETFNIETNRKSVHEPLLPEDAESAKNLGKITFGTQENPSTLIKELPVPSPPQLNDLDVIEEDEDEERTMTNFNRKRPLLFNGKAYEDKELAEEVTAKLEKTLKKQQEQVDLYDLAAESSFEGSPEMNVENVDSKDSSD